MSVERLSEDEIRQRIEEVITAATGYKDVALVNALADWLMTLLKAAEVNAAAQQRESDAKIADTMPLTGVVNHKFLANAIRANAARRGNR